MSNNKAIILLSGGLDSVVSLSETINNYDIRFAIMFYYGQNAFKRELTASKEVAAHYGIKHILVKLDWYENLLNSLQNDWIPNRNGVLINIAAAFADRLQIDNVIIGINREEGETFKDNTQDFFTAINSSLKHSTQNEVKVVSPLISMSKDEIVKIGIKNNIPFDKIYSCYKGEEKHCGVCQSCKHLKSALLKNGRQDLINKLF